MTSDVGGDPGELYRYRGEDRVHKVDTSKQATLVGLWQVSHQRRSRNSWYSQEDEEQPAVAETSHAVRRQQADSDSDRTAAHIQQGALSGGVTKAFDQSGAVGGNDTATTAFEEHDEPLTPELEVAGGFS